MLIRFKIGAEEPLPAGGSCNLGALNLSAFIKDNEFDFDEFSKAVELAVRCQNDILEEGLNRHPLKEQKESVERYKQIGVGIMGLADMFIKLKIKYGSKQAIDLCDKIGTYLNYYGMKATTEIGSEKGCYKDFNSKKVLSTPYYIYQNKCFADYDLNQSFTSGYYPRNSQLFTIAPTGSISTMLGISGGIEPIFANYYERTTKSLHGKDVRYKLYTPIVKEYMEKNHLDSDEDLPEYFVTSADIPVDERIDMQAVWQSHIDASISSTVNLPNSSTVKDVEDIYMRAWEMGLKGITVYRAGCAREGILTVEKPKEEVKSNIIKEDNLKRGDILCVSDDLLSMKRTIVNGCGRFYLHVDFDEYSGEPLETFIDIGSEGGCERNLQFISRLMSLALRAGVPLSEIIDQANSIKPCNAYTNRTHKKKDTSKGTSCPSAIGNALKELQAKINNRCFVEEEIEETISCTGECTNCSECTSFSEKISNTHIRCPECGQPLIFEGGCNVCKNCGWSKCS